MVQPGRHRHNFRIIRPSSKILGRLLAYVFSSFLPLFVFYLVTPNNESKSRSLGKLFFAPSDIPSDTVENLDAILVLGGGAPKAFDEPPVYVQRRADDALEVISARKGISPLPILCLSAGTAHVPQALQENGLPLFESTACAAYLEKQGKKVSIYVETVSYDTIGNAFYTRTTHTDVNGWRNLLVVTSEVRSKSNLCSKSYCRSFT